MIGIILMCYKSFNTFFFCCITFLTSFSLNWSMFNSFCVNLTKIKYWKKNYMVQSSLIADNFFFSLFLSIECQRAIKIYLVDNQLLGFSSLGRGHEKKNVFHVFFFLLIKFNYSWLKWNAHSNEQNWEFNVLISGEMCNKISIKLVKKIDFIWIEVSKSAKIWWIY